MACSLVRYKTEFDDENPDLEVPPGFEPDCFKQQLARSLAAFDFFLQTGKFDTCDPDQSDLVESFEEMLASDDSFDFFLPWSETQIPVDLVFETVSAPATGSKRRKASSQTSGSDDDAPPRKRSARGQNSSN